jgi:hypothetical protein
MWGQPPPAVHRAELRCTKLCHGHTAVHGPTLGGAVGGGMRFAPVFAGANVFARTNLFAGTNVEERRFSAASRPKK